MKEENKKILENIAYTYTKLANFNDKDVIEDRLKKMYEMEEDDVIDRVLVTIYDFVQNGRISKDDALYHLDMLCELNKDKYKTRDDLVNRLGWLKSMNLMYPSMPLKENHRLVLEAFDEFNKLINGENLDYFYTGGMMGYLATGHELVRYHGDLDILINEEDLEKLKRIVEKSDKFEFVSHVKKKNNIGHEYFVVYKGIPIDIGLFLFERKKDGSVIRKSYYYKDKELLVDEEYLDPEYVKLSYTGDSYIHNGIPYKMMSLESVYEAKRGSRPKDQYDAKVIEDMVDMEIVERISDARKKNTFTPKKKVKDSVVERIERSNKR